MVRVQHNVFVILKMQQYVVIKMMLQRILHGQDIEVRLHRQQQVL
jgi:hypothetical protein